MAKQTLAQRKANRKSKYWQSRADNLWGQIIHEIYQTCPVGKDCAGHIEAHHLISRSNKATRHRIENGIGLCSKHHKFCNKLSAHGAPLAFAEWLMGHDPDKWLWCSENKQNLLKADYRQAYEDLQEWCKENAPHLD